MSEPQIDAYIEAQPAEVQPRLRALRALIQEEAPEATERMAYGLPTFFLNGNLIHFGAFTRHIGLYPTPTGMTAFDAELAPYKRSKGAVQLPLDEPMPDELIRKIVRHRVAENRSKPARKAPRAR